MRRAPEVPGSRALGQQVVPEVTGNGLDLG